MTKWLMMGLLFAGLSASANMIVNPDFTIGADGLDFWEGYDVPSVTGIDPATFVTTLGGVASVSGYSTGETAFYQTFTVAGGALASGTYEFSAIISAILDPAATMFIKVWDDDAFGGFKGAKFQNVLLTPGLMTLTYEHDATDLVQFGFGSYSATQGFDVSNPSVTVVPEPTIVTLLLVGSLGLLVRKRR